MCILLWKIWIWLLYLPLTSKYTHFISPFIFPSKFWGKLTFIILKQMANTLHNWAIYFFLVKKIVLELIVFFLICLVFYIPSTTYHQTLAKSASSPQFIQTSWGNPVDFFLPTGASFLEPSSSCPNLHWLLSHPYPRPSVWECPSPPS